VQGQRRFAIRSLDRGRAYLRADVDWLDESPGKDVDILAEAVARLFEGIVETLDMAGHASADETWKEMDPRTLSFRVAAALPGAGIEPTLEARSGPMGRPADLGKLLSYH